MRPVVVQQGESDWHRAELENIRPSGRSANIRAVPNTGLHKGAMKPFKPSRPETAKERGGVLTSRSARPPWTVPRVRDTTACAGMRLARALPCSREATSRGYILIIMLAWDKRRTTVLRARDVAGVSQAKRRERPQTANVAARGKNGAGSGGLEVVGAGGGRVGGAGGGVVRHATTGDSRVSEELLKLLQERAHIKSGRAGDPGRKSTQGSAGGPRSTQSGGSSGRVLKACWDPRVDAAVENAVAGLEGVQEGLCIHSGKAPGGPVPNFLVTPSAPGVASAAHLRKLSQLRNIYKVCSVLC